MCAQFITIISREANVFIYHFNRLIRSRILWGFFVIIISIAFVAAGSCFRAPQDARAAGKLNGKKISAKTFDQMTAAVRGSGRNRNTDMPLREVERRAWEQIAAMQVAEANGFAAGEEDVRDIIRGERMFQGQNGFDMNMYSAILRDQGLTPDQYERLVRNHILLMKVNAMVEAATWVSPMELDDEIASMTDVFTVQAATLSNRYVNVEMRLSGEPYKAFYDEHSAQFALPDRLSVRYITIPVSNYHARVTLSDDDLQDYYDAHMDAFKTADTNSATGFKTFEEVRDEIHAICQREEAQFCAETNLTFTLFGKLSQTATALETLAAAEQAEVKTSPFFTQNEPLYWTGGAKDFAKTAFDLDPENPDTRFGIAKGKDEIFVMEYHQKSAAHVPAFADVEADVKQRAQAKARTDAFDSYVKEMRTDITKLMGEGKAFSEAAAEKTLNVSTSLTYTVSEVQTKPFENGYSIAYGAMTLKKGDLSEAVPTSATQALLIYVLDRQPGVSLTSEVMRPQIRESLSSYRNRGLLDSWLSWNLTQSRLETNRVTTDEDDTQEPPQPGDDEL